ncbi:hypothetical protein ACYSNO_00360 [Enterococcus sp. LJL98]
MEENRYIEEIQALKQGDLKEIVVNREDFIEFRNAWLQTENRTEIVGEAGLNGQITYRFVKLNK